MRPLHLALAAGLIAFPVMASEGFVERVGGWIVECHQTEAGGRECQLRNDEDGKPALEQAVLLSFTLQDSGNQAEGLVRVADLELPPRLEVELAFGAEVVTIEGVGRRGRLAARFSMPRPELPGLAVTDGVTARFTDKAGEAHEVTFPTTGLAEALALAEDYL